MHDSAVGRLLGVLVAPGRTFRSIAARPTWVAPLLAIVLVNLCVGLVAAPRIDYEDIFRQQVARSGREVPQEVMDKQVAMMTKNRTLLSVLQSIVAPLGVCLLTLGPWVAFRLLGSELTYLQALSVMLYSFMAQILAALLSLPVLLSRSTLGYADIRTGSFLKSNLASLIGSEETNHALYALFISLDLFSLWMLILLILGYREVARVSTAKAVTTMIVLWALVVGCKMGWAAVFG